MEVLLVNPPWYKSPRAQFQAWFRSIVRQRLLHASSNKSIFVVGGGVLGAYAQTALNSHAEASQFWATSGPELIADGQNRLYAALLLAKYHKVLSQKEQFRFLISTFLDLTLFLAAYNAVYEVLFSFAVAEFQGLRKIRDKIKALNLPLKLIPHSLHPINSSSW